VQEAEGLEYGREQAKDMGEMPAAPVAIHGGWITLGQLLKRLAYIQTGGEAKSWLVENRVLVNGKPESRRGRKLHPGDTLQIGKERYVCIASTGQTPPGV
jgi:ribosome-associated protein YbcJ (S4-like RNA binding protein)